MEKESVFELIRKEEMILFAGAGMSLYAGFPSGKELAKILHKNLPISQQNEIELSSNLLQVSEDIFNIRNGNKNYLITKLKECFEIEPSSKETHQLLAKIPQIKTIITTNYDTLFEDTNKNLQVIRRSSDYPIANSKKQQLFKIHGDLSDTTNIILTKSDYNKFFIENKDETVFWTAIKDRLASNNILFIGYSLEDNNVMVMFDRILSEIGENRKELFFVDPSISQTKKRFLDRKGINYIESTGEDLIKEIYEDLKLNYIPGLSKGDGTADTAINFGQLNKIDLQISKRNDTLYIGKFSSLQGIGNTEMKFNLELPDDKREGILKALNGNSFDDVILDSEIVKGFSHFFNGIRLANEENITKFHLRKRPNIEGIFEFVFEDGFELENYKMEVFIINPEENQYQIKIIVTDFTIIIKLFTNRQENKTKYSIQICPNNEISSVKTGLNFYNIVSRIASNKSFKLIKNDRPFYNYNSKIQFEGDPLDSIFLLDYFKKLKIIEQFYNVKFKNIDLNQIKKNTIDKVIAYIEKRPLKVKFDGLNFINKNRDEIDHILETCKDKGVFLTSENIKSTYCLHRLDFETGYLNQIIDDAYIVNTEDLINNITNKVEIKSRTESMQIEFSDEQDMLIKQ
jgi:NAD-dependent SIR2 family protein deacetylase